MRFGFDPILAFTRGCERAIEEQLLVDVTWIKGDEVLRELGAEVIDLREDVGHIHDVAHRETRINLAHLRPRDEPRRGLHRVLQSPAREDEEVVLAAHRLREEFGRENLFFAPNHAVLQRRVDVMLRVQSLVHHLDVVDEANEHVRLKLRDLIEVERGEEPVAPAECRVGVDDDVAVLARRQGCGDDVFKRRASQGRQSRDGEIEDASGSNVRRLGVHHVAEVEEFDRVAAEVRRITHGLEVRLLVDTDLASHDRAHAGLRAAVDSAGTRE